ncbi:response regulator [Mariprofundus erugo]|uniref:histidine kinase n=1 Tax=Mariprofundus erugo TaxID=2528639 RepID=A0A5R9GKV8_9PROT|nr:response regulator [Mariprofundus erugo]TLS65649.1 response regulator [Mariprofundus erugo]
MRLSLPLKTAVVLTLLISIAMTVIAYFSIERGVQVQRDHVVSQMRNEVESELVSIRYSLQQVRAELRVLAELPPVSGLVRASAYQGHDPEGGVSDAFWHKRLEQIFVAHMRQHPMYHQMRLLDAQGMELVRVNQTATDVEVVARDALQSKRGEFYFSQALATPPGQLYYSPVSLNREHGKLERPYLPMLRICIAIHDSDGKPWGVIMINVRARWLFDLKRGNIDGHKSASARQFTLTDQDNRLLPIVDAAMQAVAQGELAPLYERHAHFAGADAEVSDELGLEWIKAEDALEGMQRIYFNPDDRQHYWLLHFSIPAYDIFDQITEIRRQMLINSGLGLGLILLLVLWYVNRTMVQPVLTMVRATSSMRDGDLGVRLDAAGQSPELAQLFTNINAFAETQEQLTTHLEEQVAERTQRLSSTLNSLSDAVLTVDADGVIVSVNDATAHLFGYADREVVGGMIGMVLPHAWDKLAAELQAEGGMMRSEQVARHLNGTDFPVEVTLRNIIVDGSRHVLACIRDITERKQRMAEIRRQNSELTLRQVYDTSYAKILTLFSSTMDREFVMQQMLDVLAEHHPIPLSALYLFDERHEEMQLVASRGCSSRLAGSLSPADGLVREAVRAGDLQILNSESLLPDELSIQCGIVAFRPAAIAVLPVIYQKQTRGVLIMAASALLSELDQQYLRRLGHQLGVMFHNLQQYEAMRLLSEQLQRQSIQIGEKNAELERASNMKSEFLANMSHELRTPLNAIIGFSEIMRDGLVGDINEEQHEYCDDIYRSGQHLLELINDILDLSKIEAGKMELDLTEVAVCDLVQASLSIVREKANHHAIRLESICDQSIPAVRLDARRVKQVLFNLLSNAVKFTPDGGRVTVTTTLRRRDELPQAPASQWQQWVEISVRDNGIGISADDLPRLFQSFQQLEHPMTKQHQGTGLGLVMVKRLVEMHGGSMTVESREGEGSCFTLWLPVREDESAAACEVQVVANPVIVDERRQWKGILPGSLVLIVEDDDGAAKLIGHHLENAGYRTWRVESAERALEFMRKVRPDVITLDIMLPGMDGWQLMESLKHAPGLSTIPVIIISIVADAARSYVLGASRMLCKPVRKHDLLDAMTGLGLHVPVAGAQLNVLVVDDDPVSLKLIRQYLDGDRYHISAAGNGRQALEMIAASLPDLIILDLMMPQMDGFELAELLSRNEASHQIPILVITAKELSRMDRERLAGKVDGIISKSEMSADSLMNEFRRVTRLAATGGEQV